MEGLEVLNLLLNERPQFHGRELAGRHNYAIATEVLEWLAKYLPYGCNTIETGCGYSTIILGCIANKHIAISPFTEEHQLIISWCAEKGIATDRLEFIAKPSQDVVPNLPDSIFDFVLIDGDHAFPAPFIDWYYLADMLRVGGYLAIDDTQIPTGRILKDFLTMESDRWRLTAELGKTTIFRRTSDLKVAKGIMWNEQPFCLEQ